MSIYEHIDKLKELKENFKQEFIKNGIDLTNVEFYNYYELLDSLGVKVQLFPVEILSMDNKVIITDNKNGSFANKYKIYSNGEYVGETNEKEYLINNFEYGENNITAVASGEKMIESEHSNTLYQKIFRVTKNYKDLLIGQTLKAGLYQTLTENLCPINSTYLPREVQVLVGGEVAEYVYNCYTGEIIISNVIGDVEIIAQASKYPTLSMVEVTFKNNEIFWNQVEKATSYKVYVDGIFLLETQDLTINLSGYLQEERDYIINVTALANGYNESALSEPIILSYLNEYPIYGIRGFDNTGLNELERTYDAVGLNYYINSSQGLIVSDFDNVFPYNEIKEVVIDGNVMVKIPQMYFKVEYNYNDIITGFAVSCYPRREGNWFKSEEFYVGKYLNTLKDDNLVSLSNAIINKEKSINEFQNLSKLLGENYGILNFKQHCIIRMLMYIEYAVKNFDSFIIKDANINTTGTTDSVDTISGYNLEQGNFKYRYIEDFLGGCHIYLSGLKTIDGVFYTDIDRDEFICLDLFYSTVDKYVYSYKWLNNFPFYLFPIETNSSKETGEYSKVFIRSDNTFVYGSGGVLSNERGLFPLRAFADLNYEKCASRLVWENKNDN